MDRPEVWWRLLGPSKYISKIATSIRSVPVVAVSIPVGHLPNYMIHIGSEVDQIDGYLTWSDLCLGDESILSAINTQLLTRQSDPLYRPSDLVGRRELEREVIVIGREDVNQRFDELCSFIAEFAAAATRQPDKPRPTLLIDLPTHYIHEAALNGMGEERIKILPWKGYVSRHDMLSYVSHLMVDRDDDSPITPSFLITLVTYISGWDPRLASLLARSEQNEILDNWPHLKVLAEGMKNCPGTWAMGFEDDISGKPVRHTLWLAKQNKKDDFHRIVWAAHLTELFPWLEEKRLEFTEEYRDKWRLPIIKPKGPPIVQAEDLELGEMFYYLTNEQRIPAHELQFLDACKTARHDLAHRRAVSSVRIMKLERLDKRQ
ncbi:MAG: hypothetical protein OQK35_02825 [Alphaproteobacteria bacterium]|nr:hypothetical protein [Alphaproteobacteria bacterium]